MFSQSAARVNCSSKKFSSVTTPSPIAGAERRIRHQIVTIGFDLVTDMVRRHQDKGMLRKIAVGISNRRVKGGGGCRPQGLA